MFVRHFDGDAFCFGGIWTSVYALYAGPIPLWVVTFCICFTASPKLQPGISMALVQLPSSAPEAAEFQCGV